MYLDNSNVTRKKRTLYTGRANGKYYSKKGPPYLRITNINHRYKEISLSLNTSDSLFFSDLCYCLYKTREVKIVYTKLDLTQTNRQLFYNKHFKTFIGEKQLIYEYS